MDSYDDIFDNQIFQFSPIRFPSSPESFTSLADILQDPILEETETVIEDHVGLIANHVIGEANPSMSTQQSDLLPLPETSTILQNPPELQQQQQLLSNSSGYLQGNLSNIQSDQQCLSNQNMFNCFEEGNVSTMQQQQQQLLSNSSGYLQGNLSNIQSDQQCLSNQNMFNCFEEGNVSTMQQQQLLCNPHGYSQENLPNGQPDQNMVNSFQQPNISTMMERGQVEGAKNGTPPTMISFELPGHLQEQRPSIPLSQSYPSNPTYQHDPFASPFNMYNQQPPPITFANREAEPLVVRRAANLARTHPLQNQTSMTPPLLQRRSSSTRSYPLQSQTSRTPPLRQILPRSTRHHGEVLVNQPLSRFRYPHLDTYTQISSTNSFTTSLQQVSPLNERPLVPSTVTNLARTYPPQNQVFMTSPYLQMTSSLTRTYPLQNQVSMTSHLPQMPSSSTRHHGNVVNQPSLSRHPQLDIDTQIRPITNSITPIQSSLEPGERSYRTQYEHGESSSAPRRRIVLPERNVGPVAENRAQERTHPLQNQVSMTPPLRQTLPSTRTYPLQNQVSVTPFPPHMTPSSTRPQGNTQELVNQPSSNRYRQLDTNTQICPTTNTNTPLQSSLGPRQRSNFEQGESSSAQRRRIVMPERNVGQAAENRVQERLRNRVYSPHYESLGLYPDPHMRRFYNQE